MSLSLVFAAALMMSGQDGPIVTQQRAPTETAEALRTREAMAYAYPLPANVPTDDYGFLGWCSGLIEGHIALGETLGSNADAELMRLGRLESADFVGSLRAGASRATPAQVAASRAAHDAAMTRWQPYLTEANADVRQEAFDLFFGLPGRCEHASRRTRNNITTAPATLEQVGLTREEVVPASLLEAEAERAAAAAAAAQPAATPPATPGATAPATTPPATTTPATTAPATTAPASTAPITTVPATTTPRPTTTTPATTAPATGAPVQTAPATTPPAPRPATTTPTTPPATGG